MKYKLVLKEDEESRPGAKMKVKQNASGVELGATCQKMR